MNKCMLCGYVWQADIDNSGTIDYGEFLAATVHLNKLEREENLVRGDTKRDLSNAS